MLATKVLNARALLATKDFNDARHQYLSMLTTKALHASALLVSKAPTD
jgi:hypothetical protein